MKRLFTIVMASCVLMAQGAHLNEKKIEQHDDLIMAEQPKYMLKDYLKHERAAIIKQLKSFLMTVGGYSILNTAIDVLNNKLIASRDYNYGTNSDTRWLLSLTFNYVPTLLIIGQELQEQYKFNYGRLLGVVFGLYINILR